MAETPNDAPVAPVRQVHNLKTNYRYFAAVRSGGKCFEVRRDDRGFQRGDLLRLLEYNPDALGGGQGMYVGVAGYITSPHEANVHEVVVTYVLTGGQFGIAAGHVVMGTRPATDGERTRWPAGGSPRVGPGLGPEPGPSAPPPSAASTRAGCPSGSTGPAPRNTRQPRARASSYFSASAMNPATRWWRPPAGVRPSISAATRASGQAKSNRHLRVGWNRCSRTGSGRPWCRHINTNDSSAADAMLGRVHKNPNFFTKTLVMGFPVM